MHPATTFKIFFSKKDHPKKTILIIDEASRLSSLGDGNQTSECTSAFINVLRTLKGDRENFNLRSLLLVGTAATRDLLLPKSADGSPSISPFSSEGATFNAGRFTKEEVQSLMAQYAAQTYKFDAIRIGADIFDITAGHRGLVGVCGNFIQDEGITELEVWQSSSQELITAAGQMAHYKSIIRALDKLSPNCKSILIKILYKETEVVDVS
jgi:hypothetical protein